MSQYALPVYRAFTPYKCNKCRLGGILIWQLAALPYGPQPTYVYFIDRLLQLHPITLQMLTFNLDN